MADLKLGLTLLNDAIERVEPKREREERARELAKAEEIAAKEKVGLSTTSAASGFA